ncbi:MAG: single-stranded DNA-binding protein [Christensenellales bacterium]
MNKVFIIGNLTRDPELRTTSSGVSVCSFTVAVNRRGRGQGAEAGQQEADFYRVSAWRQLGENCNRFLAKGRKVAVVGDLSLQTYTGNDGQVRSSLEVQADSVEFLTPRSEVVDTQRSPGAAAAPAGNNGFVEIDEDELPF